MTGTSNKDVFTITIPRLSGYKTLVLNGLAIVGSIAVIFWPDAKLPDAQTTGALIDSLDALVVAGLATLNILIRLITTTPVAWQIVQEPTTAQILQEFRDKQAAYFYDKDLAQQGQKSMAQILDSVDAIPHPEHEKELANETK